MKQARQGEGAGAPRRTSDERPTAATVAPQGFKQNQRPDSRGPRHAGQALQVIEGEGKAAQFLARLQAEQAGPDELALIVSMLYGAKLRGFCRAIEKALGVSHA